MSKDSSRIQQRTIVVALVVMYLLLAFCWQGIRFADESDYLYAGIHFQRSMFVHQVAGMYLWSPLYAAWFKLLSFAVRDPVRLYFVSWALLVVIVACIPLWMRMRSAWLYTLILTCAPFFSVWPYVSLFVCAFLVSGICVLLQRKLPVSSAALAVCVISFVMAFARPEFQYGMLIAAFATLVALVFDTSRGAAVAVAGKVAAVLLLSVAMVFVMKHAGASRSGVAFAQHYNLRAAERGELLASAPMFSSYAQQTFHIETNQPNINLLTATLGDFYKANPHLFFRHVLRNALDLRTLVPVVFVLVLCFWMGFRAKDLVLRAAAVYIFLFSLPVFAGMLFVFPREHYIQMLIPSLVVVLLYVFSDRLPRETPSAFGVVAVGVVLMLAATAYRVFFRRDQVEAGRSNRNAISCMRALERSSGAGDGTLFNTLELSNVYLAIPRYLVTNADIHTWPDFTAWAGQNRPGWIVIDRRTAYGYAVTPQQISSYLLQKLHYTPHPCPDTEGVTIYTTPQANR